MKRMRLLIPSLALVWASVILSTATILEGTPYAHKMLIILGGGAAATSILLGSSLRWVN